ncbi:hypothetical protein BGX38DRAFT_1308392 [Terfezia claveryi]|nr:hypothetical protein BGX38DRAFT_1308392 [Terfezia claveryi]
MPTTPGARSLSGVSREADELTKYSLPDFSKVEILRIQRPTAERAVLQIIIFYFLKGIGDIDKLRVKDIAALNYSALRLAYLSACNTANSTTFIDEVTHIISSFHIAGYNNVIGTLWPAQDDACQKMGSGLLFHAR